MAGVLEALLPVLKLLLGVLVDLFRRRAQPTAEDGRRQDELRERLRSRVRSTWRAGSILLALSCIAANAAGCGTRTVYVAPGEPVRLRETIRSAKVWVLGANGTPVAGRMDLPEGWYCLPLEE